MKRLAMAAAILTGVPALAQAQFVRPGPPAEVQAMPGQRDVERNPRPFDGEVRPLFSPERRNIERSIRAAERSGDITAREARSFRRELSAIGSMQWRSSAGGSGVSGEGEIQSRLEALRGMVNARRVRGGKP